MTILPIHKATPLKNHRLHGTCKAWKIGGRPLTASEEIVLRQTAAFRPKALFALEFLHPLDGCNLGRVIFGVEVEDRVVLPRLTLHRQTAEMQVPAGERPVAGDR